MRPDGCLNQIFRVAVLSVTNAHDFFEFAYMLLNHDRRGVGLTSVVISRVVTLTVERIRTRPIVKGVSDLLILVPILRKR